VLPTPLEPCERPFVARERTWPKKLAKRGLSVGRQAAMMPTYISTLGSKTPLAFVRVHMKKEISRVLLPNIVPRPHTRPICNLEEVVLHRRLVDGDG